MKKTGVDNNLMVKLFLGAAIVMVAWAMARLIFWPEIIAGTTGIVVSLLLGGLFAFFAFRSWQDSARKLPSPLLAKEPEATAAAPASSDCRPAPSGTFSFDDLDPADRVSLKRALEVQEDDLVEMGMRRRAYNERAGKLEKALNERDKLMEEGRKAVQ